MKYDCYIKFTNEHGVEVSNKTIKDICEITPEMRKDLDDCFGKFVKNEIPLILISCLYDELNKTYGNCK